MSSSKPRPSQAPPKLHSQWLWLWGLPVVLLAYCWWGNPFGQTVAEKQLSLQSLSPAQKSNVTVAFRHLNGIVIPVGGSFSFNRVVGPRTVARGYQPAPSYLGGDSPSTIGGGICLLSSALYQLALTSDLRIEQRVAHLRPIHSVPPGLDATVWYGGADLKFENTQTQPLRLSVTRQGNTLTVAFYGQHRAKPVTIRRVLNRPDAQNLKVAVFRNQRLLSSDRYRLAP